MPSKADNSVSTSAERMDGATNKTKLLHDGAVAESYKPHHIVTWSTAGTLVAAATFGFAMWFPFVLAPVAATKTYLFASFNYDSEISHFDNTIWTYGTDYLLGVVMAALAVSILRWSRPMVSDIICRRSAGLLLVYCVSVVAGGYCHQTYTTLESRNSLSFRVLWTVCVGTVSAASAYMGSCGSDLVRKFQQQSDCHPLLKKMPVIPEPFWWAFGLLITIICASGGFSFQRPACDIFVAGITQFPSTLYIIAFFIAVQHTKVKLYTKVIGCVGFILNCPLLPLYPLLIQYTDWSLASVNTLLHCWLCVAWSMQGISLRHMILALVSHWDEKVSLKTC